MSIGSVAEFFWSKSEANRTSKESYNPSQSPLSNPNEQRERRNKFAKIHALKRG